MTKEEYLLELENHNFRLEEIKEAIEKLKEDYKENSFPNNARFTFTVNDGYCEYQYPLNISSNNSIDGVAKKIYEAFELPQDNGVLIKP